MKWAKTCFIIVIMKIVSLLMITAYNPPGSECLVQ